MKIGIIGSGGVGQRLANGFKTEGHDVTLGTRNVSKPELAKFKAENPQIRVATFADTAAFGELLVICTAGGAAEEAMKLAGLDNFKNKVVIDTTNPIGGAPEDGVLKFFTNNNDSLMQQLQRLIPEAKFVKAFNSVGNYVMYKPSYKQGPPTMFICGNDADAKQTVTDILTSFGWETEDMGKAIAAGTIESLCILWCIPGFLKNEWTHAFKLLKN
jgi:predicted dinucleotide-binding enzyme